METTKQSTFRNTTLVLAAATVLAVCAWGAYAYLFHQVSVTGREDSRLAIEAGKLDSQQSLVIDLKNDLADNQARQPILNSYFVDATDPVPLFETLEGYGRTANVAVVIDSVDVKRQPDRLVVSFTGTGSFASTYRFLALVEAAPYEFTFTNVVVRALPGQKDAAGKPLPKEPVVWESRVTMSILSVTNAAAVSSQK